MRRQWRRWRALIADPLVWLHVHVYRCLSKQQHHYSCHAPPKGVRWGVARTVLGTTCSDPLSLSGKPLQPQVRPPGLDYRQSGMRLSLHFQLRVSVANHKRRIRPRSAIEFSNSAWRGCCMQVGPPGRGIVRITSFSASGRAAFLSVN